MILILKINQLYKLQSENICSKKYKLKCPIHKINVGHIIFILITSIILE